MCDGRRYSPLFKQVSSTHAECDVLDHVEIAFAPIDVHLAYLVAPVSSRVVGHSSHSSRTCRATVGVLLGCRIRPAASAPEVISQTPSAGEAGGVFFGLGHSILTLSSARVHPLFCFEHPTRSCESRSGKAARVLGLGVSHATSDGRHCQLVGGFVERQL